MAIPRHLLLLLFLLALFIPFSSSSTFLTIPNSEPSTPSHSKSILCLFPLSGHYALLQRLNFYLVLLFAARAKASSWLVGGAFAAAMSVSGVAVIHAILLLIEAFPPNHKHNSTIITLDLDAAGAWSVLAPAALLVAPILSWTPALRDSGARSLIRIWGAFVTLGAVCTFAALVRTYPSLDVPTTCPSRGTFIRDTTVLTPTQRAQVFGSSFKPVFILGSITLAFFAFITLPACFFDTPGARPSRSRMSPDPTNMHTLRPSAWRVGFIARIRVLGTLLCVILAKTTIGFTEAWLAQFPGSEGVRTVGQWGVWVATALVVIAGLIKGRSVQPPATENTDTLKGHDQGGLIRIV